MADDKPYRVEQWDGITAVFETNALLESTGGGERILRVVIPEVFKIPVPQTNYKRVRVTIEFLSK